MLGGRSGWRKGGEEGGSMTEWDALVGFQYSGLDRRFSLEDRAEGGDE